MARKPIGSQRPLVMVQARFKREVVSLFTQASRDASNVLFRFASNPRTAKTQVEQTISDLFTGRDNHHAYGADGLTPLAPYPKLLNQSIALATYLAVKQQHDWLKANTPDDVFKALANGRRRGIVSELQQVKWIPPHKITDERGYQLSDRIWRSDIETRRKIDELLSRGIADGRGALDLANALEAYLVPGREGIRTLKPYGYRFKPGGASYDAMRLARTEIAAAFNNAAWIAGKFNPYVVGIDVARSANGDATCPICPQHATIGMGGERLREPYDINDATSPPFHPHCMCYVLQVVTEDRQGVIDEIRQFLEDGGEYEITPADLWGFLSQLLDPVLIAALLEMLGIGQFSL